MDGFDFVNVVHMVSEPVPNRELNVDKESVL